MDAIKYLKIKNRMTTGCTVNSDCLQCALYVDNNPYGEDCSVFEIQHPEEAVKMVEKWGKEHPAITRMDEFMSKHPNAKLELYRGEKFIDICPVLIEIDIPCHTTGNCYNCKIEYWNEEVEE